MNIEIGKIFLGFKILKIIGKGGFGTVYLGERTSLASKKFINDLYAIKILHEIHTNDEKKVHRFHREARLAIKLSHPNAIKIYEDGETFGLHYIIMEYATGKTLLNYINGESLDEDSLSCDSNDTEKTISLSLEDEKTINLNAMSDSIDKTVSLIIEDETKWIAKDNFSFKPKWEQACLLMEQCALVLEESNKIGILHRDIKPDNILIFKNQLGEVKIKILDFGLIKDTLHETMQISIEGEALGTPSYMSPEQFSGEVLDIRSDLYSLGATFYSFITKEIPFKSSNIKELMQEVLFKEPKSIKLFDATINNNVAFIISKLLRKNKDERYQTPSQLIDDIKKILNGENISEFKNFSKKRKKISFIIVSLFCAIAFSLYFNYYINKLKKKKNENIEIIHAKEIVSLKDTEEEKELNIVKTEEIEILNLNNEEKNETIEINKELPNEISIEPKVIEETKEEELKNDYVVGFGNDFKDSTIKTNEKDRFKLLKEKRLK